MARKRLTAEDFGPKDFNRAYEGPYYPPNLAALQAFYDRYDVDYYFVTVDAAFEVKCGDTPCMNRKSSHWVTRGTKGAIEDHRAWYMVELGVPGGFVLLLLPRSWDEADITMFRCGNVSDKVMNDLAAMYTAALFEVCGVRTREPPTRLLCAPVG